ELTARLQGAERKLDARRDERGRRLGRREDPPRRVATGLQRPATARDVRDRRLEPMTAHRRVERSEPFDSARLAQRAGEQADSPMAMGDEMADEELEPRGVVEQDGALAGALDAAVEEHAGRPT